MKNLVIYGAGGHASVVADTARNIGWHIIGYIDDTIEHDFRRDDGVIVHKRMLPKGYDEFHVICAIGDCNARFRICRNLHENNYQFATIIHPFSSVSSQAHIGCGVYIGAGAVIDPGVNIGDWSIINNHAAVCHDTSVGAACHIAPGTSIASRCVIEDAVWIGVGVKIKEMIHIGKSAFIGAGSVVVRDVDPAVLAYGVPAKKKRDCSF